MKNLFLIAALCCTLQLTAQQTGKVDYPYLGISFTIPDGWLGQEQQGFYLMGSNSTPGYLMISTHEATSLNQLRQLATLGFNEESMQLQLADGLDEIDKNTIGGEFSGSIEWQPAKAYIIGQINPQGKGVLIMATTTTELYNMFYRELAMKLKSSLVFYEAKGKEQLTQWKQQLTGVRLTYMDSYYSPSSTDGGESGGYSSETKIDLCNGFFNYGSRSSVSASGDGISGYSGGNNRGNGTWDLEMNVDGSPALLLNFHNGEQYRYDITMSDGNLYLNSKKYFRTTLGEYAPNCY